jgi:hypothetical protein
MEAIKKLRLTIKSKVQGIVPECHFKEFDVPVDIGGSSDCKIVINSPNGERVAGIFGYKGEQKYGQKLYFQVNEGIVYFNRGQPHWNQAGVGSKIDLNKGNKLGFLQNQVVEIIIEEIITENVPMLFLRWGEYNAKDRDMRRAGFRRESAVYVGANPQNTIQLDHGFISGNHGVFHVHENSWIYQDDTSTNGSFFQIGRGQVERVNNYVALVNGMMILFYQGQVPIFKILVENING